MGTLSAFLLDFYQFNRGMTTLSADLTWKLSLEDLFSSNCSLLSEINGTAKLILNC